MCLLIPQPTLTNVSRAHKRKWLIFSFNPGPAEPRNIWETLTILLCVARKYLDALVSTSYWYLYIGPLPLMAKRLINQLYRLIVPALVNTELNYLLSPSITGFLCFYIFDTWAQYRLAAPNDKRATGLTANDNLWPHRPPAASHNRHNIAIVTGARGQLLHTVILHLPKLCNKSCNATVHVSNMHTGRYKRHLD